VTADDAALFSIDPAAGVRRGPPGRQEAALRRALEKGFTDGRLIADVDEPLAESAMILARVLDTADRIGDLKGGYLAAQAQPALQKALHALRMPAEITPTGVPLPAGEGSGHTDLSGFLGDAFGTPT
jgi:hypothetical protein